LVPTPRSKSSRHAQESAILRSMTATSRKGSTLRRRRLRVSSPAHPIWSRLPRPLHEELGVSMWNARRSSLAFAALLGASSSVGAEPTPNPTAQARISAAYGKLPLTFEANEGQVERPVKFLARGPGATLFLTPTEAVLSLGGAQHKTAVVRMQLVGANRAPHLSGLDLQETRSNYFIGNDSRQWHTVSPTTPGPRGGRVLGRGSRLSRQPAPARVRLRRCPWGRPWADPASLSGRRRDRDRGAAPIVVA
jgi:hypothetical protein